MSGTVAAVQIVSVPKGEAPHHIRQAWVGLTLPLAVPTERLCLFVGGVLTMPRTVFGTVLRLLRGQGRRERGYIVESRVAVEILAQTEPEAAWWWRENTPHLLAPGQRFVFDSPACREVAGMVWPPPPNSRVVGDGETRRTWTRLREIYNRAANLRLTDLGWWWPILVFLTGFLAKLVVDFTPRRVHIPIGIAILLLISVSALRDNIRKRRQLSERDREAPDKKIY